MILKMNTNVRNILFVFCLVGMTACGSEKNNSSSSITENQQQRQEDQGIYRAVLKPINKGVAGESSGTVEVKIQSDEVRVMASMVKTPAGVKHRQNIMLGEACPTVANDINSDGLIDIKEAISTTGPIFIPLDSNLASQLEGIEFGPIANSEGAYVYQRSTGLANLLSDLKSLDPDPTDLIVKLSENENLNLSGRVVLIHGVNASAEMAETVASFSDISPQQALPIACGVLQRVNAEESEASAEE